MIDGPSNAGGMSCTCERKPRGTFYGWGTRRRSCHLVLSTFITFYTLTNLFLGSTFQISLHITITIFIHFVPWIINVLSHSYSYSYSYGLHLHIIMICTPNNNFTYHMNIWSTINKKCNLCKHLLIIWLWESKKLFQYLKIICFFNLDKDKYQTMYMLFL